MGQEEWIRNDNILYVNGNAAPQVAAPSFNEEQERKNRTLERNIAGVGSGIGVDIISAILIAAAIAFTVLLSVKYLKLQEEVRGISKSIENTISQTRTLKVENDAFENSLETLLDLDYVYYVAVNDLGMVYPNGNEVIYYDVTDIGATYQFAEIPTR